MVSFSIGAVTMGGVLIALTEITIVVRLDLRSDVGKLWGGIGRIGRMVRVVAWHEELCGS